MEKVKKYLKVILSITIISSILFTSSTFGTRADAPYRTFTVDGNGVLVETQTAYLPVNRINMIGDLRMNGASDLQIVNDIMYIADSENGRILVADLEGNLIRTVGEGILSVPRGIFVTNDHRLYVADEWERLVFVFDETGEFVTYYGRPDHPLFGDNAPFIPQKVVVDNRGNIFVISQGNTNGIIQLSQANNGEFLGYFGVNRARITLLGMFRDLIFNEEQRQQLFPIVPATTTNMDIDSRGLIHTVTEGDGLEMLEKLNMAGNDMLGPTLSFENPTDVLVGPYGNIFVATASGFIIEYTSEGQVLFIFGGQDNGDQRVGLFHTVSAIALDSQHRLYVLDRQMNEIQIFERTEFAKTVHEALIYYQDGLYLQSMEPWQRVLEMNSLFDFAQVGIGEAMFQYHDYEGALRAFRSGLNRQGYSQAFWEIRNVWLRQNLPTVFYVGGVLFITNKIIKYVDKKKGILTPVKNVVARVFAVRIIKELNFIWTFIKRPIDGFYGIKHENRVSMTSTTIWFVVLIGIFLFNRYQTGFLFRTVLDGQYNVGLDILFLVGAFILVLSSHYLVSTVTEGEGKFKQVYSGLVYSMMPFVMLIPPATLLSNVLTFNERFLLTFTYTFAFLWVFVLIIIMIKELHNYEIKQVVKNIFVTIFTALLFILIIFIVYVLFMQFYGFAVAVFREAVHRFGTQI